MGMNECWETWTLQASYFCIVNVFWLYQLLNILWLHKPTFVALSNLWRLIVHSAGISLRGQSLHLCKSPPLLLWCSWFPHFARTEWAEGKAAGSVCASICNREPCTLHLIGKGTKGHLSCTSAFHYHVLFCLTLNFSIFVQLPFVYILFFSKSTPLHK